MLSCRRASVKGFCKVFCAPLKIIEKSRKKRPNRRRFAEKNAQTGASVPKVWYSNNVFLNFRLRASGKDVFLCWTLEIGEVTGIIHDYLIDCWNWARKKEPVTEEAELKIEQIDAVTFCEDCGQEYPTVAHGRTCPHCGSEHTYLRRGNEFLIKEIEVTDS